MNMKTFAVAFAMATTAALPALAAGGDCAGKKAPDQQSSIAPTTKAPVVPG